MSQAAITVLLSGGAAIFYTEKKRKEERTEILSTIFIFNLSLSFRSSPPSLKRLLLNPDRSRLYFVN
jgi:hypothetical protein